MYTMRVLTLVTYLLLQLPYYGIWMHCNSEYILLLLCQQSYSLGFFMIVNVFDL